MHRPLLAASAVVVGALAVALSASGDAAAVATDSAMSCKYTEKVGGKTMSCKGQRKCAPGRLTPCAAAGPPSCVTAT